MKTLPLILHSVLFGLVQSASLEVKLTSGTFLGVSTPNGTDQWLGIRYGTPPVGDLRFKAPVAITQPNTTTVQDASTFGNACPQRPATDLGAPLSEDCLFLNVFRSQNTTADAKVPVLVWIHGGAYTDGAASEAEFDPTRILTQSVAVGKPIIFVSINYRLNTFGFLSSSLVAPEDLNAGLLDQRLAFEFVQDNVAAFGGDPTKVTIWGQSAGAGSVESHILYSSNRTLFRAGMGDSSTGPLRVFVVRCKSSPPASTYDRPGLPFSNLLKASGCTFGPEAIPCLQSIPFETLLNISNTLIDGALNGQLWQPSIGPPGSFADVEASIKIQSKEFLHVPYLGGTNVNEGTIFSPSIEGLGLTGAAQNEAFINFIGHLVIDNSTLTEDANDPLLGAPFNTGDSLFDRGEAWYTDEFFLSPRRLFFENAAALQPYFIPGQNPMLGVAHATELLLLFGPVPTAVEDTFANQMLNFYINFINDMNPGSPWPEYSTAANANNVMQLLRNNIIAIPDTWDIDKTDFLNTQKVLDEFQK
ncbi:alpha/beta-hydrolase [Gymnopus androsaceus JB14]|uniref:Carboxylic ester hydrolase n=1 Tax=Gymnopus androsaceus JB14 TaxID=1447944 RepID=A0A6A4HWV4_9AGAR|nr:alpha/beta-hydrolase [Gymnopus androsaceus JB14]